jgi:hypothetical protein
MTKEQKYIILEEMKNTIRHYREAKQNADNCYTKEQIENNMLQYFTGLRYTMELLTGLTWEWSNNGLTFAVVSIDKNGRERRYEI